jgi:hypothetical protein
VPENNHYCYVLTEPVAGALLACQAAASAGRTKRATWDETFRWLLVQAGREVKDDGAG